MGWVNWFENVGMGREQLGSGMGKSGDTIPYSGIVDGGNIN